MARNRLTNELITPASAYATDTQVQSALNATQQTLKQDLKVHPTATVNEPMEGIAWAVEEQGARASLPVHPRPTTFEYRGRKIPID